jgi:hypothetical protein
MNNNLIQLIISLPIAAFLIALCHIAVRYWVGKQISQIEDFKNLLKNESTAELKRFYALLEKRYLSTSASYEDSGRRIAIVDCQKTILAIISSRKTER